MNRNIWTWIQLAASLCNAMFLVIAHVPSTLSAAEGAGAMLALTAHRVIAKATGETATIHPRKAGFRPAQPAFVGRLRQVSRLA